MKLEVEKSRRAPSLSRVKSNKEKHFFSPSALEREGDRVPLLYGRDEWHLRLPKLTHPAASVAAPNLQVFATEKLPPAVGASRAAKEDQSFLYKIRVPAHVLADCGDDPHFTAIIADLSLVNVDPVESGGAAPRPQAAATYSGLSIDSKGFLVFNSQGSIVLRPSEAFPWAPSQEQMRGHTMKIEVYSVERGNEPVLLRFIHFGDFREDEYPRVYFEIATNFANNF